MTTDFSSKMAEVQATVTDYATSIAVLAVKLGQPCDAARVAAELLRRAHNLASTDEDLSRILENCAKSIFEIELKNKGALFTMQLLLTGLEVSEDAATAFSAAA